MEYDIVNAWNWCEQTGIRNFAFHLGSEAGVVVHTTQQPESNMINFTIVDNVHNQIIHKHPYKNSSFSNHRCPLPKTKPTTTDLTPQTLWSSNRSSGAHTALGPIIRLLLKTQVNRHLLRFFSFERFRGWNFALEHSPRRLLRGSVLVTDRQIPLESITGGISF